MSGIIEPQLESDGSITVNMGPPVVSPENVPFEKDGLDFKQQNEDRVWPLEINQKPSGYLWFRWEILMQFKWSMMSILSR